MLLDGDKQSSGQYFNKFITALPAIPHSYYNRGKHDLDATDHKRLMFLEFWCDVLLLGSILARCHTDQLHVASLISDFSAL